MAIYRAIDLLDVEVQAPGRAGVWFLNWAIKAKTLAQRPVTAPEAWGGAGLYGLCFDGQLIYIGSYLGNAKQGANRGGDVLAQRWWTHIGAITARGNRVHVAPRSLKGLQRRVSDQHPLWLGLVQAPDGQMLSRDAGNLCPLRRLLFAARHADLFLAENAQPDDILSRFQFIYHHPDVAPAHLSANEWARFILAQERSLITAWAPECNATHVPRGMPPVQVSLAQADATLREVLAPIGA